MAAIVYIILFYILFGSLDKLFAQIILLRTLIYYVDIIRYGRLSSMIKSERFVQSAC